VTGNTYKRLARLVFHYWPHLLFSTLAALIYVALNSISIWLTASLINNILTDFNKLVQQQEALRLTRDINLNEQLKLWTNQIILRDTPVKTLEILCLTILGVFILKNIFLYLKNISIAFVQTRLITEVRNKLYIHIHKLPLEFFNKKRSGELTSILVNDVQNMQDAFATSFQKLFVEPINILTFTVLLFIISWKLALLSMIIVPFTGMTIILIGRSIRRKSKRTQVQIAGIMDIINETLSSIRIVKAFVMEKYEVQRFLKENEKYFRLLFRRARLRYIASPITETIGVIIGVTLLWFGGLEVLSQKGITAEDFIRFIFLLFSTLGPIKSLGNVNIRLQTGIASAERVFHIMDTRSSIVDCPNAIQKKEFSSNIKFSHVYFNYSIEDLPVLEDISFEIQKGDVFAMVGPSGAGKSTIADLIPRFYDVNKGEITIDGIDIRKITINSLRGLMGIVSQETVLFNDTVARNIAYGLSDIPTERIIAAAKAANALEFIERMPEGINTVIGERGVKLSGGQRQRLSIARALLKNPPILILDEATSSLDTESEKLVQHAIENLMEDRTVLVIAHRLSTVKNADQIVVLDKGKIVQTGTHQELIKTAGLYKDLYDIQFEKD